MANIGKPQTFPYSYKTVSAPINSQYVYNQPRLEIINPLNIFETELLYTHIRILFDASIATDQKILNSVMVSGLDADGFYVRAAKGIILDKAAVSNIVDVTLDLTPYIYKTGRNEISFKVPTSNGFGAVAGTNILQIWKADMAYTVKGIS